MNCQQWIRLGLGLGLMTGFFCFESRAAEKKNPPSPAKSVQEPSSPPISKSQNLRIYYASSTWNQNSTVPDSAFLFFRDAKTGKVAKILIEETEPDSSTFRGNFSISWTSIESLDPEVYIPPEGMREDSKDTLAKFYQLLNNKKAASKPLVFRTSPEGQQILDVYDTPEQAQQAKEAFEREAELARQAEITKKALSKPIPDVAAVEASKMAERQTALDLLAQEGAKREADRVRLEQIEKQRTEERMRQQRLLSEQEKEKRLEKAKQFAEAALDSYRLGQFISAEENFRKSVELDPENKTYYFKYAITLYRNEKFNEALVVMNLAKTSTDIDLEKDYYMGLIHFRLKELDSALKKFALVQQANHPELSVSAGFYRGVILFNQEKYEEAKPPFEWVIDNSNDSSLDNRSEEYLEKIAQLIVYKKNQAKRLLFNATIGAMYDSNVLLAPDNVNSQGSSTEEADSRAIANAGVEYRILNGKTHEFSSKLASSYMRSSKSDLSIADPWQNTITLPYVYKGTVKGKGYRLTVTPGYEALNMSIETDGPQDNILNSMVMTVDNTFIMNEQWYASYILDVRQDDSLLASSTGAADADATKLSLKTSQMFFKDKTLRRAVIVNLGLVNNAAVGDDKIYLRVEGGVTYMAPARKDDSWNLGLAVYNLNYPDSADLRKDTNMSLTAGYGHPFNEWALGNLSFNYTNNQSNVSTNQYSKFSVMATGTFNWGW